MRQALEKNIAVPTRTTKHNWLVLVDYLYYLIVALVIAGIGYYFFFYRTTLFSTLSLLLQGALITIEISLVSTVFAVLLGFIGALCCLSRFSLLRWPAKLYVEVIRGTPVLVQLLLWFYGFGALLSAIGFDPFTTAFNVMTILQSNSLVPHEFNAYFYGVIGLSFNYGAYMTEIFRSGIEGVDRGQSEASLSLGLSPWQTMRHVILPQAIRLTIPPFTNNFITLIQDSALLSVIAVVELEQTMSAFAYPQTDGGTKLFIFILGATLYFIICYPLSRLAHILEKKLATAYDRL